MSTLIRTGQVPAADRFDLVREITATTWVPMECHRRPAGRPCSPPLMERLGVTTRAEVDPATLADHLLAETLACDGCVIGPPMTGAWVTMP